MTYTMKTIRALAVEAGATVKRERFPHYFKHGYHYETSLTHPDYPKLCFEINAGTRLEAALILHGLIRLREMEVTQ